jgi:hypothetical protein
MPFSGMARVLLSVLCHRQVLQMVYNSSISSPGDPLSVSAGEEKSSMKEEI